MLGIALGLYVGLVINICNFDIVYSFINIYIQRRVRSRKYVF